MSVKSFEEEHPSQSQPSVHSETTSPDAEKANTNGSAKNSRKREFDDGNSADFTKNVKKERLDEGPPSGQLEVESHSRKRNQHELAPSGETDEVDKKKQKLNVELTSEEEAYCSAVEGDLGPVNTSNSSPSKEQTPTGEKEGKKKKKRRRNKKNTDWNETGVQLENDSIQLRILPKVSYSFQTFIIPVDISR